MSLCPYELVCAFYQHRIPIHPTMYETNLSRYCNSSTENCAIFQVLKAESFLKVPGDLYPNQTFRIADIVKK